MKPQIYLQIVTAIMLVCTFGACEKELTEENETQQIANSRLTIRTRAPQNEEETTIAWPIQVYVFAADNKCVATKTIDEEEEEWSFDLTEGTYTVCAVGGAAPNRYVLPSKENASLTALITLQDGMVWDDLMVASSTVTLVDGEENSLTLGMERKTVLLREVTVSKVPSAATAVSISIAPLWQSLALNGDYSQSAGTHTVALERQTDGRTWKAPTASYLLPSSGKTSITVSITQGESKKSYTYTMTDLLEANYKVSIHGTYTEAVGVTLSGSISGVAWAGERHIQFDFDESGSSTTTDTTTPQEPQNDDSQPATNDDIPAVGSTYKGCYVLSVTDQGTTADVLLLSPHEANLSSVAGGSTTTFIDKAINNALPSLSVEGIEGWRIMFAAEAQLLFAARNSIEGLDKTNRYYYYTSSAYAAFYMNKSSFTTIANSDGSSDFGGKKTLFRPVAKVSMAK